MTGEPGEFVGMIQKNHPVRDFDGYAADQAATKRPMGCQHQKDYYVLVSVLNICIIIILSTRGILRRNNRQKKNFGTSDPVYSAPQCLPNCAS